MLRDQWNYPVTTEVPEAAEELNNAYSSYYRFRTNTARHFDRAIEADPDFALPHILKGLLIESLKKPEINGKAVDELEAAKNARPPATARERHYLAALEAALSGRITEATTHYQLIVNEHPLDLFAMRFAQSELFWIGEAAWMRDISEQAAPHWTPDVPGYSSYLSVRSFGLEENGDYVHAEQNGRKAVELAPDDCWGAHAVAHVLIMQGRHREGIDWLNSLDKNWSAANHIVHHLWWHLALFYLEQGKYDAALDIFDEKLRDLDSPLMQAIPDYYVDIQNDVALLQRLELRNVDVGDRWQPVADLAQARIGNHASPFTSAHCALALSAAGRFDEAGDLVKSIEEFIAIADNPLASRYSIAVLPACKAVIAHRRKDYRRVIDYLLPARRNLRQMGGSHAQRDLFYQILIDATVKMQRFDLSGLLLTEIKSTGFTHLEERSSYADAVSLTCRDNVNPV